MKAWKKSQLEQDAYTNNSHTSTNSGQQGAGFVSQKSVNLPGLISIFSMFFFPDFTEL